MRVWATEKQTLLSPDAGHTVSRAARADLNRPWFQQGHRKTAGVDQIELSRDFPVLCKALRMLGESGTKYTPGIEMGRGPEAYISFLGKA